MTTAYRHPQPSLCLESQVVRNLYNYVWFVQPILEILVINSLNAELNPTCDLLALLGAHPIHISRIRVNKYFDCIQLIGSVSIPDGVVGIFHLHNTSSRTMALGLTQSLPEMSTRNISCG
jgi:hypothetical protein